MFAMRIVTIAFFSLCALGVSCIGVASAASRINITVRETPYPDKKSFSLYEYRVENRDSRAIYSVIIGSDFTTSSEWVYDLPLRSIGMQDSGEFQPSRIFSPDGWSHTILRPHESPTAAVKWLAGSITSFIPPRTISPVFRIIGPRNDPSFLSAKWTVYSELNSGGEPLAGVVKVLNPPFFPTRPANQKSETLDGILVQYQVSEENGTLTIKTGEKSFATFYTSKVVMVNDTAVRCGESQNGLSKIPCRDLPADIIPGTTRIRVSYWTHEPKRFGDTYKVTDKFDVIK